MANTKPVCSSAAIAQSLMDDARRIGLCDINQCISITKDFDGKTVSHLTVLPPESALYFRGRPGRAGPLSCMRP